MRQGAKKLAVSLIVFLVAVSVVLGLILYTKPDARLNTASLWSVGQGVTAPAGELAKVDASKYNETMVNWLESMYSRINTRLSEAVRNLAERLSAVEKRQYQLDDEDLRRRLNELEKKLKEQERTISSLEAAREVGLANFRLGSVA